MKKQSYCSFMLAGVNLNEYGLEVPSPFTSLSLNNSQITSMTSWELTVTVGGDANRRMNIAAFEALLYSAAQSAYGYENASGIPVSFMLGWLDQSGNLSEYLSYSGFTLTYKVTTTGQYMVYTLSGYAQLAVQTSMPVLNIPEVSGIVQPSAILEALAKGTRATDYYQLDIDHNDAPTYVNHGALTTSFNSYVRGVYSTSDDYDTFPGLLRLSKSYNQTRDAGGLDTRKARSLSQVMNNTTVSPVGDFLKKSITDNSLQSTSFSYWVDEPTMTQPGTIHYKSNAGLNVARLSDMLEYGTSKTNILSLTGSYNGVSYNIANMNFSTVGFIVDGSGNAIVQDGEVVNSWSSSLSDVFQSANIINDVNALATQFAGDFSVTIPGSTKKYTVAQPVSLLVMSGNTVSPVTGVYNIVSVTHTISVEFTTTLQLQRLVMSSANEVATTQNIFVSGKGSYGTAKQQTDNIISTGKVDFGHLYPDFSYMKHLI